MKQDKNQATDKIPAAARTGGSKLLKIALPYIVALLSFFAVAAVYFAPQFEGRVLPMHDEIQYRGMSQDIREHVLKYGQHPQWEGNMFSGMPAYMISFDYGTGVIKWFDNAFRFMGGPASMIMLAMMAFFLMLLLWGVNPWAAIVPSLAYGLSTYTFLILGAGHLAKVLALAYAPAMIGGVAYAYRRNVWVGGALAAFFASLQIAVNHPQITYYFVLVIAALVINELVKSVKYNKQLRFAMVTSVLIVAALLAVWANFGSLWYGAQYSPHTTRGGSELSAQPRSAGGTTGVGNATGDQGGTAVGTGDANGQSGEGGSDVGTQGGRGGSGLSLDYATAWSYGKAESFNLLVPDFMGGASSGGFSYDGPVAQSLAPYNARNMATQLPSYWGDQPYTAGPTYIGAVAIFIAALGLFLLPGRRKWWVTAIMLLALMLSWGYHFMPLTKLFFYHFPGYNKFRAVSTILVILQWGVPLLGALALGRMWRGDYDKAQIVKAVKNSLYVLGGLTLIFALFGGALFSFTGAGDVELTQGGFPQSVLSAMQAERASMLRSDALRSLVFICLGAGTVLLWAYGKLRRGGMVALLAVLVVVDLFAVNMRYLPQSKFVDRSDNEIRPTSADLAIMADTTLAFRVANFTVSTFNDATTSYFHRSVGGYHGAKLSRYQDIIDRHLSQMNMGVFNMLNTKYFIVSDPKTQQPVAQLNPGANGPAWLVDSVKLIESPDRQIEMLGKIDTRRVAIVEPKYGRLLEGVKLGVHRGDTIVMTDYRVNYQRYISRTTGSALAVISEIYYPDGWTCAIDGVKTPYLCANYILRGAVVPAGEHVVEFTFAAPNYKLLTGITRGAGILVVALMCAALVYVVIRKKDGTGEQAHRS